MKYFKNTELATIYHVSEKSVRNWIEATQKGKLDLELHKENDRHYVANTTKNLDIIQGMVEERKKFTNSRAHKVVKPGPEFYKLYSEEQIVDIITNIETYHEIPLQYSYFNGGAVYWKEYVQKLEQEPGPNMLSSMVKLLDVNQSYIDGITHDNKVNIVDLGIGDATPVKKLLAHLQGQKRLNRYIGVDFSKDMLDIASGNVQQWFGESIKLEPYLRDLNYDRFETVLRKDVFCEGKSPLNIVLLIGGTLTNYKDPNLALHMINASMGKDDYLVYGLKLDTDASRRYFDFNVGTDSSRPLAPNHALVLDLLNIDESLYEVEQFFDEAKKARFIQVRMKVDITIDFTLNSFQKKIALRKGQSILIWRYWHQSAIDVINQFDVNGFELLQASLTEDKQYLLTISKVRMS